MTTPAGGAPAAWATLGAAALAADNAPDAESALRHLTAAAREIVGDKDAHLRPGALNPGQHQFSVSGVFLVTPDGAHNLLIAEHGFPPEQHRLRIPADLAHPGWVVKHQQPLLLANTDDDPGFRQILKTARMGSALYAPMFWRGRMLGQLVVASQARNTYGPADLEIVIGVAHVAAVVYVAHGGPQFLQSIA
jgi:GAF domain-containing protein